MIEHVYHCTFVELSQWNIIQDIMMSLLNKGLIKAPIRMGNHYLCKSYLDLDDLNNEIIKVSLKKISFILVKTNHETYKHTRISFKKDENDLHNFLEPHLVTTLIGTSEEILNKILDKISLLGRDTLSSEEEDWLQNN